MTKARVAVGNPVLEQYEARMEMERARFERESALATQILDPGIDPETLELFLVYYHALGYKMTEPVEDWMRRGGERCLELGLEEIGQGLCRHASQEAGHYLLMLADARALAARWNARHQTQLEVETIIGQLSPGGRHLKSLPAQVAESDQPFRLISIDYEVERLAVVYGPRMLEQFSRVLGEDVRPCLSFLEEHVVVDVGHTIHNRLELAKVLAIYPECLELLIQDGADAMFRYDGFLGECLGFARTQLAQWRRAGQLSPSAASGHAPVG
jgi:hypothetical protein